MNCVAVIFHTQQQQHRGNEYLAMVMYYTFTYKQKNILADFTRYFSTGFFVCDKYAPLQTCVTCWFVCFVLFVAEFRHQMLNPRQVNNPAGERREKKVQDHQLLQTRASHAEQWRRVCFLFFPLLVCFGALLRLKSYFGAVTFLNSSLAVDFSASCRTKSLHICFSFFCWNWGAVHSFHSSVLLKQMA